MRICENGIYRDMTKEEIKQLEENKIVVDNTPTLEKRVTELERLNQQQDELINISLLATDEMYMMLEPLLAQNVNLSNEESISKMVNMYVVMIKRNLKNIEDVPTRYREEVIAILK